MRRGTEAAQIAGALIVGLVIVLVTILIVTASLPAGGDDDHGGDRTEQRDNSGPGGADD